MVNWTDHGARASAAVERNGHYYFYAPVDRAKIGVARSTSPTGGFADATFRVTS